MGHLLLVDDDPDLVAEQVRHAFPAPAHLVEIARTGAEGIARVAAKPPDVVLLTTSGFPTAPDSKCSTRFALQTPASQWCSLPSRKPLMLQLRR